MKRYNVILFCAPIALNTKIGTVAFGGDMNKFYRDTRELIGRVLKIDNLNDISIEVPATYPPGNPKDIPDGGYDLTYFDNDGVEHTGEIRWVSESPTMTSKEFLSEKRLSNWVNENLNREQVVSITSHLPNAHGYASVRYVLFYWSE